MKFKEKKLIQKTYDLIEDIFIQKLIKKLKKDEDTLKYVLFVERINTEWKYIIHLINLLRIEKTILYVVKNVIKKYIRERIKMGFTFNHK